MMIDGCIPPELESTVESFFENTVPKLLAQLDRSRLFFWDTAWLGLATCWPAPNTVTYDAVLKTPLHPNAMLRLCRRCGAVMEDLSSDKLRELPSWLIHAQRYCVCATFWTLV